MTFLKDFLTVLPQRGLNSLKRHLFTQNEKNFDYNYVPLQSIFTANTWAQSTADISGEHLSSDEENCFLVT